MLNPVRKLTDNMGGDEDQSIGFEPEEESTNFYHPGFGIKVALRNYAPVPHLLPILRHLRGNLFSFYRGKIITNASYPKKYKEKPVDQNLTHRLI